MLSCFLRSGDWDDHWKWQLREFLKVSCHLTSLWCIVLITQTGCEVKRLGFSWLCRIGNSWAKTLSQNLVWKWLAWVGLVTKFRSNYLHCAWFCGFGLVNITAPTCLRLANMCLFPNVLITGEVKILGPRSQVRVANQSFMHNERNIYY